MDMDARGQIVGGLDQQYWSGFANADGLRSPMWLLSYEAARKGWWKGISDAYVRNDNHFGQLLQKDVFFYDIRRNVSTTFAELKRQMQDRKRIAYIFRNIDGYI
jgi:hypothetical protein